MEQNPFSIPKTTALVCGLLTLWTSLSLAGPLQQAEVHKIINDVRVLDSQNATARPAKLRDIIKGDLAVRTAAQSRAELLFQDETLTRLGPDSVYSFKEGTRDMTLDRGTMLLQVPKNLGGARIRTAAVTAAITGTTIMVENVPGKYVKVLVLEGSLDVSINAKGDEVVKLTAGKMVTVRAEAKDLPKPVTVDLGKIVRNSQLVDPDRFQGDSNVEVDPLPSIGLIEKEVERQSDKLALGNEPEERPLAEILEERKNDDGLALELVDNEWDQAPRFEGEGGGSERPVVESVRPVSKPANPTVMQPNPGDPGTLTPPPVNPGTVTPPPVNPGTVTPPPVDPGTVTPPPTDPGTVTPPPTDPGTVTPPPVDPGTVTPPPVDPGTVTPPPVDPGTVTPPPVDPGTVTPPPVDPGTVTPPPVDPGTVTPPPVDPGTVTPPPVDPGTVTPPPVDPGTVTPPPVDPGTVTPPPVDPGTVTPPPVDPGTVTPPPVDPGTVTPPPVDPGTVTPPPVDPGTVTPPPVDPGTVTPPPVDPGTVTPPPVDPGTVTPPPVDPGTVTPPPVDPGTVTPPPPVDPGTVTPVTVDPTTGAPGTIQPGTAYMIKASTVIDTTKTNPLITTDGRTDSSLFYRNATTNGSASVFLFGGTSTFETQIGFDTHFNSQFPSTGVYKFSDLIIDGNPTFLTKDGANRVAWISASNINTSTTPGQVSLDGVKQLFLGTASGSINLSDKIAFAKTDGTAFSYLELYARNGNISFGAPVTLKDAKLRLTAEKNVTILPTANIWTAITTVRGLADVNMNGWIKSDTIDLAAGSSLTTTGTILGKDLTASGATGVLGGSITADNGTFNLTGNTTLSPTANFNVKKLIVNGGGITMDGAITGEELNLTSTGSLAAQSGSRLTALNSAGSIALSSGSSLSLDGQVAAKKLFLTAGTNPLQIGNVTLNGTINSEEVTSSGASTSVNGTVSGKKLDFTSRNDFTASSGSSLTTTTDSSAALNITAGGRILLGGTSRAKAATLIAGTNPQLVSEIQLNGPMQIDDRLTASANLVTLNALLTTKDANITAGSDFFLKNSGGISATGDVLINAGNLIQMNGNTTMVKLTVGGGGDVVINGRLQGESLLGITGNPVADVALNGVTTLSKELVLSGIQAFTVGNTGSVNVVGNLNVGAGKDITLSGATSGMNVVLSTTDDFLSEAAVVAGDNFNLTSRKADVTSTITANHLIGNLADDFTLANGARLTATRDIKLTSTGGDVTLNGNTTSETVDLAAKGTVTVAGSTQATGRVQIGNGMTPNQAVITGQITGSEIRINPRTTVDVTSTGRLTSTGTLDLTAQRVTVNGQVSGTAVTMAGSQNLTVGGTVQGQSFQATGGTGVFNGSVTSAQDLDISLTSSFTQGATGVLTATRDIDVTGTSAALNGKMTGRQLNVTSAGNLLLNGTADLRGTESIVLSGSNTTINGRLNAPIVNISGTNSLTLDNTSGYISAQTVTLNTPGILSLRASSGGAGGLDTSRLLSLTASGKGIVVENDFALSPGESTLTAGVSGIDATDMSLAGFKTVEITGGDYLGHNLTTQTLKLNTKGDVILTGSLTATEVTLPGTMDVAGTVTADRVDALTAIVAGGLSVGDLKAPILTIGSGGVTRYASGFSKIDAPLIKTAFSIAMNGISGASDFTLHGGSLELITGAVTFDALGKNAGFIKAADFSGGDAVAGGSGVGGDGGVLKLTSSGAVTVASPITADTGRNGSVGLVGGSGGTVEITANSAIAVNSKIKVSSTETSAVPAENTPGRASRNAGNIKLTGKLTTGTAISVNNSGELLSLLNAASPGKGGKIEFVSSGGAISVNGGKIVADKGTIDIQNKGAGNITLTNSTLRGDVVKANAMGANGQLIVGGGSIDANTTIKLYATGSNGSVIFNDNVALNGNSVKTIAASTVTINNGKVVTINGPTSAQVFTDRANYTGSGGNKSTTGTFGGRGATTQPLINRPGY